MSRARGLQWGWRHYLLIALGIGAISIALFLLLARPELIGLRQDHTWAEMQSRGTWRVGLDASFPPFESLDENGVPVGYDVDMARGIAEEWGLELEIVPIGFDSLLDALQAGRVDSVISALPFDPLLTRDVTYSAPYFEAGIRLVVRGDSPLRMLTIKDAADFAPHLINKRIAVEWGGQGDGVGRRLQRDDVSIELLPFSTPDEAATALQEDRSIDALLVDNVTLRQRQGQGADIHAVGPALEGNPYVVAMPRQAFLLYEQVGLTLQTIRADGTLNEIEKRWFGSGPK